MGKAWLAKEMLPSAYKKVTLASLKRRSGLKFRDGARVTYVSYTLGGESIHRVGQRVSGAFHQAQEKYGIRFFARQGCGIFARHIGVAGANGWADFAVARGRRVILVECVTDWFPDTTIPRKMALAQATELWFITESWGMKYLRRQGYRIRRLPCPNNAEFRGLNSTFWLCRPASARPLARPS